MADDFDPYHKWLGIPRWEQPANHYRLLGLTLFESDPDVIEGAADQRMAHLRTHQVGAHSSDSQKLLNGIAAARLCLLSPDRKTAYDTELMQKQRSPLVSQANKWPVVQPKVVSPEPIALAPPSRRRRRKYDPEVIEPVADNDLRSLGLLVLVVAGVVVLGLVVRDKVWPEKQVKPAPTATEAEPEFFSPDEQLAATGTSEAASPPPQGKQRKPELFRPDERSAAAAEEEVPDFFDKDEPPSTTSDDAPDFFRDE